MAVTGAIAVSLGAPAAAVAADVKPREGLRDLSSAFGHTQGNLALAAGTAPRIASAQAVFRPAAAAASAYTVEAGDTITGIAIRQGLRTVDLLTWNGLSWSSTIYPGQVLRLTASSSAQPAASTSAQEIEATSSTKSHTVASGDTVWSIAQSYGTSVDTIVSLNELGSDAAIYPGQKLVVASSAVPQTQPEAPESAPAPEAAPSEESYVVQAGDTLWSIAQEHGISVSELLATNGLNGSSIIYPGQKIIIPAPGGTAEPQADEEQEPSSPPSIYDSPQDQLTSSLNAPQTENAQLIIRIGRELGIPDKGIAIALATAMVESSLRNVDWGDRDSLGLFQQRPSTGWGSEEQILDRDYSIRVFFGGPNDPNGSTTRGLLDIPGWQDADFGTVAQTVQISAFPDRYGRWEQQAYAWLAQLG
ncbi:LysM peptidoglycan-binding domain-containing protein [Microbacterium betulae]|uniref:LysM peptidoglycan-binding domain-containing protein n=1 Tax=Microbacterium betulae TaxID=2981139 RepID=A0AA97I5A3_9MICO|nr:LysM peptidoglycan-binding domain-containing protein [Microbacterium sp. AB]WOF21852.1 LysM peptidoglycan-binding domain-containing protein [Microbacterium sp. AB]